MHMTHIITAMNTHIYGNYDAKNIYETVPDIDTLQFSKSIKSWCPPPPLFCGIW